MIIFAEPICFEEQHLFFNKTFVNTIKLIRKDENVIWCGDKIYGQEIFSSNLVKSETIEYQKRLTPIQLWRRYGTVSRVLNQESSKALVIFLSFDNSLFPFFCLLNFSNLRNRRVICMIHNNLKSIQESAIKKLAFQWLTKLVNIDYVVLTESMKNIADRILTIDSKLFHHPFYQVPMEMKDDEPIKAINFLVMGRQAIEFCKSDLYNKFIEAAENSSRACNISIISPIPINLKPYNSAKVVTDLVIATLSSEEYWEYFRHSNFVIFPPSEEIYYRASGVLMDTFASGSIFIAPESGHFSEFNGCGLFYTNETFSALITKALYLDDREIESMRNQLNSVRILKENDNNLTLKELLSN
jgi:hypothetical protein